MDYKFQRTRTDKIPQDKIIEELEKAARFFNYDEFKRKDFNSVSKISFNTVVREFGTWNKALKFLADYLKTKNIDLKPGTRKSRKMFTEKGLFNELERIWKQLGHRPSKDEWILAKPKTSYLTFCRYFDGWQNACLKFIEYKMGSSVSVNDDQYKIKIEQTTKENNGKKYKPENTRTIPLRVRLQVLDRDKFRCVLWGESPATEVGVKLHIDHIVPFSSGGKSIIENLQTLCQECNLGKGNKKGIGQNRI